MQRLYLAAPLDVNVKDSDEKTALIWAAQGGHTEVVTTLLAATNLVM